MQYTEFERIISQPRMQRYLVATGDDTRKTMTLYRLNLKISQECYTIISCFEIALRNAIDEHYVAVYGNEWLKDAQSPGGIFTNRRCRITKQIITQAYTNLGSQYTHSKLLAEMDFGFWRFLFAQPQFYHAGQSLLNIFPNKPNSTPLMQYNQRYVFNELKKINYFRNRIAHHEPICFRLGASIIDTTYLMTNYNVIQNLFHWMNIDSNKLLYGLDHIDKLRDKLNQL